MVHNLNPMRMFVAIIAMMTPSLALAITTNNGVTVESVDHYGSCYCDLYNNKSNVDGLLAQLTPSGSSFFVRGAYFYDTSVYDTDFYDPNVSGSLSWDNDTYNFDSAYSTAQNQGNGIAFYSGHGFCDDLGSACVPGAVGACNNPPSGMSLPGACLPSWPGATTGTCAYYKPRSALVNPDASGNHHSGVANYSSGRIKFGERSSSPWTGHGTNGSSNFVVMDISCPARHHAIWNELGPAFAGLHTFATLFMTTPDSDTMDASDRGSAFGKQYAVNPSSSIATSWTMSLNSVTSQGTHGIYGHGAHSAVSAGANSADSYYYRDTESWSAVRTTSAASGPYGWWSDRWTCNYDCFTYPLP